MEFFFLRFDLNRFSVLAHGRRCIRSPLITAAQQVMGAGRLPRRNRRFESQIEFLLGIGTVLGIGEPLPGLAVHSRVYWRALEQLFPNALNLRTVTRLNGALQTPERHYSLLFGRDLLRGKDRKSVV